jgi:hypothetical protein
MPLLGFKPYLVPLIQSGAKPFTLRLPRLDGRDPKVHQTLYLYTGLRTRECRKIGEVRCFFAAPCWLLYNWIAVGDWPVIVLPGQLETFAQLDGFKDYAEFCRFHGVKDGMKKRLVNLIAWQPEKEISGRIFKVTA